MQQEEEAEREQKKNEDDQHQAMLRAKVERAIYLKRKWKAFCWYVYFPKVFFKIHIDAMLNRKPAEEKTIEQTLTALTEKFTAICLNPKTTQCFQD